MKVLVIDDEEMIRKMSKRILEKAGFEVLLAENGQVGIDLFNKSDNSIPIVLVDMNMDGLSGVETIQLISKQSSETQYIISSGNDIDISELPDEIRSKVKFLMKPYRSGQLTELIESILQTA